MEFVISSVTRGSAIIVLLRRPSFLQKNPAAAAARRN
jgi:hypothetical protein